jgi:hypothetical protein
MIEADVPAFVRLPPADLESQANVLLHKRYEVIRRVLPVTCARLGDAAWQTFKEYARTHWPPNGPLALSDAGAFCDFLGARSPDTPSRSEWNRILFARRGRLFSASFVPDVPIGERTHFGIQILLRSGKHGWRELTIYFCL